MSNVPKLRFDGFDGEWLEKRLGEVITNKSKKYNPSQDSVFYKCIELEHLESDTGRLLGHTNSEGTGSIKNRFYKNNVLFGKLRPYLNKYHKPDFDGVCSSEIWVLSGLKVSNDFAYRIVQTSNFLNLANQSSGSKMPRADWKVVESGSVSIPPSDREQQKIAAFLTSVDTKIEQLTHKEALLKQYKKGVMQKIFSQDIRFKADDGSEFPEWVETNLGKVTKKISIKNKDAVPYPVYSISNKRGFVPQDEQFEGVDSTSRNYDISMYKIVGEKTFAYNPARINVGSIGYSGELKDIIVSSLYVCFQTSKELDDAFFRQYLTTFDFNKNVLRNVEGGVRDYLFYENFSAIKFRFPSISEQKIICEVFESLDNKIKHIQKQLAFTQTFKKGLLQQMFV